MKEFLDIKTLLELVLSILGRDERLLGIAGP
jgi:hypothetical protein